MDIRERLLQSPVSVVGPLAEKFPQSGKPKSRLARTMSALAMRTPNNVGPQVGGTGTTPLSRQDTGGNLCVQQGHGKYTEAASRGVLFAACHNAGDAPGTTISTTAMLCLYNPAASSVRIAVKKVWIAYVSGTIGTGTMYHAVLGTITQTAPTGTAPTAAAQCLDVGNAAVPQGVPLWTATVVAPKVIAPFMTLSPILASSVITPVLTYEDLDGCIVLEPGTSYQLQSIAAGGSSPLFASGIMWEEFTQLK